MIQSILDTDLYKASTSFAYWKLYPLAEGTFTFYDRNNETYDESFVEELRMEFARAGMIKLTDKEFEFVKSKIQYIDLPYWEWLKTFRFEPERIKI